MDLNAIHQALRQLPRSLGPLTVEDIDMFFANLGSDGSKCRIPPVIHVTIPAEPKPRASVKLVSEQSPEPVASHGGPAVLTYWELTVEGVVVAKDYLRQRWCADRAKYAKIEHAPRNMVDMFHLLCAAFDPPDAEPGGREPGAITDDEREIIDMLRIGAFKVVPVDDEPDGLVKPLEWDASGEGAFLRITARTPFGLYSIMPDFTVRFGNEQVASRGDLEAAKSAAFAHYSARIMSTIKPAGMAVGPPPPSTHLLVDTGCKDKDGNALYLGDRVRYRLEGSHTKREYWNPEYEIIWDAPSFTLKHVGGGKDGGSHAFILKHGGFNGDLTLISRGPHHPAPQPREVEDGTT